MDLTQDWLKDVTSSLASSGIITVKISHPSLYLFKLETAGLVLNLISLSDMVNSDLVLHEQESFDKEGLQMVQLWQDVWENKKSQVLNRISSLAGLNQRIHGRKTIVTAWSQDEANDFFNKYHLQGTAKSKYNFCLIWNNETVAAGSFSDLRPMPSRGIGYKSAELIRFATKSGYTVTGGLTKLIKHFSELIAPNDIMSYADRDWSSGRGYDTSGFSLDSISAPAKIWLDRKTLIRYFPHRLPKKNQEFIAGKDAAEISEYLKELGFMEIFNTGNLKYILYL